MSNFYYKIGVSGFLQTDLNLVEGKHFANLQLWFFTLEKKARPKLGTYREAWQRFATGKRDIKLKTMGHTH